MSKRSAHRLELSRVLNCAQPGGRVIKTYHQPFRSIKQPKTSLTFHLILGQDNRGPVGEDIWNSAKSLVHEPGGHSTHWHFCEGKPTVSRSSYIQALRSFETDPFASVLDKQNLKQKKEKSTSCAKFSLLKNIFSSKITFHSCLFKQGCSL